MASDLIERLKLWSDPAEYERHMVHWDGWRKYIKEGGGGSWPRDAFESLLDAFAQDASEAATALATERERAEKAEKDLNEARAEIERMTPKFVAYEYLESPAGREMAEASLAEAKRLLKPFADFAEKAERFVQGRAVFGGDPVMPTKQFRLKDFRDAARFLAQEEGRG